MKKTYLFLILFLFILSVAAFTIFLVSSKKTSQKNDTRVFKNIELSQEIPSPQAQKCGQCHQASFELWQGSQHARANQSLDQEKFSQLPDNKAADYHPTMQIGLEPLIQYLIPAQGGRFQVFDHAWDPQQKEWFYVFEDEGRKEGEWGHWQGRGMNWNSQCAVCHMTAFDKGYDIKTDTYHSTWKEMGVSCIQCHGDMSDHPNKLNPAQIEASCASCHARREELRGGFAAGDAFSDFYRLMLPDRSDLFYPDGQTKGEVFEYNSFQLSKMGHAGVTCLDCHDPHSGKLKLPVKNNALCLSCHQAPGIRGAIPIDPLSHSHHPADSTGHQCVNCHMPAKAFMVRDFRRDHGFTIPDPVLTKEWNIPNACNTCHQNRSVDWAIQHTKNWYGENKPRSSHIRAQTLAKAQAGEANMWPELLKLAQKEEIPAWRATLILHLGAWAEAPEVKKALKKFLQDKSPLVRSAAVQVMQNLPESASDLHALSQDPTRLVRLDVAWASAIRGEQTPEHYQELLQYLDFHADQPVGAVKLAQLALAQQNFEQAQEWLKKVILWDPGSAYPAYLMGRALYALKQWEEAEKYFEKAIRLDPQNAEYTYHLALFLAERDKVKPARKWLEKTVELSPAFGRAWYNLGLLFVQEAQLEKAIIALEKAEALLPQSPEPPQVLSDLYLKKGQRAKSYEKFQKAQKLKKTNMR